MWQSPPWSRCRWGFGVAALATVMLSQAGFAEQPLKRLPEDVVSFSLAWVALPQAMAEVTKEHGPLAGASWGILKGSSEAVGRVVNLLDASPAAERLAQARAEQDALAASSPSWLNLGDGGSRRAHHEPALLRYTF